MLPGNYAALISLCCLTASLGSQSAHATGVLRFVKVIRVLGCPLTVYFHNASRAYYLAPAYCITGDYASLLTDFAVKQDTFSYGTYSSFPLVVTDELFLTEARRSLATLLEGRQLEFLQPLSARATTSWNVPMVLWEAGQGSGQLRLPCRQDNCHGVVSQITSGRWYPIESIRLASTVRIPGSQIIELQQLVSFANKSRILLRQSSSSVLYKQSCLGLKLAEVVKLNEYCHATVLQSSYRRGHFVVEPVLCYEGQRSTHLGYRGGVVTLILETRTDQVRDILRRKLATLPALQVDFLDLVEAEVRVSPQLSGNYTFEPLRLGSDGARAELRILCDTKASHERLISSLDRSPIDVWRHISLRLESQLMLDGDSFCTWQSHVVPFSARETVRGDRSDALSDYHPIDGLLCIRPAFKRLLPPMPDSLCAIMCSGEPNCQAFSTAAGGDGSCELFLFDKCSLHVRDCGCRQRGRIFVRRRAGLEPGQVCPSGFGNDLCGVKYKLIAGRMNWETARNRSESQPGLVIMADVIDRVELDHIVSLCRSQEVRRGVWLGGSQRPGSAEPAGGWFWVGCDRPVDMRGDMWHDGQPDNFARGIDGESVMDMCSFPRLNDNHNFLVQNDGFLSKCVSPF